MNLLDTYRDIFKHTERWEYYSNMNTSNLDIDEILSSNYAASDFVHRYFAIGDKKCVFSMDDTKMVNRWIHSVSTFFLGIHLYNNLSLFQNNSFSEYTDFLYLWFITCLYHDYGYIIENEDNKILLKLTIKKLFQHYKEQNNDTYYLLSSKGEFSNKVRKEYFDYCRKELKFINHGIIGGLLLYSHMKSHLLKILNGKKELKIDNLKYSISLIPKFERCANAIIAHNIWINPNSPIEELRKEKIEYMDCLTALLVLCDTIEPLKAFPCCNPLHLLQCLSIDVVRDSISITYDCPDEHICFDKYISHCKSLNDWTNIQTCYIQHGIQLSNVSALLKTK